MVPVDTSIYFHMETLLLQDPAISQAKIIDLAPRSSKPPCSFSARAPSTKTSSTPLFTAVVALADPGSPANPDAAVVVARARKALRRALPAHKALVPRSWSLLPSLPVTTPGGATVDEAALTRRLRCGADDGHGDGHDNDADNDSGRETVEDRIVRVVARSLRLRPDDVSPAASFRRLGGDSITAIQVTARCVGEGLEVHVLDVLACRSLAHLARLVDMGDHVHGVATTAAPAGVRHAALAAV